MPKKLNLETLELQSFTTTLRSETEQKIAGGFHTAFCLSALCKPKDPGPDDPL